MLMLLFWIYIYYVIAYVILIIIGFLLGDNRDV